MFGVELDSSLMVVSGVLFVVGIMVVVTVALVLFDSDDDQ